MRKILVLCLAACVIGLAVPDSIAGVTTVKTINIHGKHRKHYRHHHCHHHHHHRKIIIIG